VLAVYTRMKVHFYRLHATLMVCTTQQHLWLIFIRDMSWWSSSISTYYYTLFFSLFSHKHTFRMAPRVNICGCTLGKKKKAQPPAPPPQSKSCKSVIRWYSNCSIQQNVCTGEIGKKRPIKKSDRWFVHESLDKYSSLSIRRYLRSVAIGTKERVLRYRSNLVSYLTL
jgi:hypothetical protein